MNLKYGKKCQDVIKLASRNGISIEQAMIITKIGRTTLTKLKMGEYVTDETCEKFLNEWLNFVDDLQSNSIEILKK